MTSTFSVRPPSDATSTNNEQLTNAKPNFDVISLLRQHPNRSGDSSQTNSNSLDFGTSGQLYGGDHMSGMSGQDKSSDMTTYDPSVPVQLIDAQSEIHRAQDAFRAGDPARANEWLKDADQNLKSLLGPDQSSNAAAAHGDSQSIDNSSGGDSHASSGGDSHASSGGDSHASTECPPSSSDCPPTSSTPPESQPQSPLQQIISTLSEALQALAKGDMQTFQALLAGLVSQIDQMNQSGQPDTSGMTPPDASVPTDGQSPQTGIQLPGLPLPTLGDGSSNQPTIPFPTFNDGSTNQSSNQPGIELPALPSISVPGLPTLPGLPSIKLPWPF